MSNRFNYLPLSGKKLRELKRDMLSIYVSLNVNSLDISAAWNRIRLRKSGPKLLSSWRDLGECKYLQFYFSQARELKPLHLGLLVSTIAAFVNHLWQMGVWKSRIILSMHFIFRQRIGSFLFNCTVVSMRRWGCLFGYMFNVDSFYFSYSVILQVVTWYSLTLFN